MWRFCRCVFKNYSEIKSWIFWSALKSKTREDRTSGIQIQYKIEDDTNIENITSEKLLSHVNTKRNFAKYLSGKIAQMFSAAEKQYIVACSIAAESDIVNFPEELKFHSHEEADTLIVLQSIDVAKSNPFVNYMGHFQTEICSSCFCTFTCRYVIIIYFTLLFKRLMLDGHTMH